MTLAEATRTQVLVRRAKKWVLAGARLAEWHFDESFAPPSRRSRPLAHALFSTRVSLRGGATHPLFEAGKRHNVALAAIAFDGVRVTPKNPFSFWRALGRVTEARGYRHGMELSSGCIVPAVGGGICLLARVLFQGAVACGMTLLERHGHSLHAVPPPRGVPFGFDAAVLWPYIDLRFGVERGAVHIAARVKEDALIVTFTADEPLGHRIEVKEIDRRERLEASTRIITNRLLRRRFEPSGALASVDVIATNRTVWLNEAQQQRSCLTCDETACRSRVLVPG